MMKKISAAFAVVHLGVYLWAMQLLEDVIPIHYNSMGQVDRYGSKYFLLIFALMPLVLVLGHVIYAHCTRNNERVARNRAVEGKVIPMIVLMFIVIGWAVYFAAKAQGGQIDVMIGILCATMGILMIGISNYMGKMRQNRTLGIKIWWTLRDETVWNKTHRLAAYTGMICGAVMLVSGIIGMTGKMTIMAVMFFVALTVFIVVPVVYAHNLYYRLHPKQ